MEDSEYVLLGTIDYTEAKRLKSALEERGVILKLVSNPQTCGTGGCAPKLEVFVKESDTPRVKEFMIEEHNRSLGDLTHEAGLMDEVFDSEKESARCPACGTEFSTRLNECPDCGLCFGGGEASDEPSGEGCGE
jgi:hypothetical protein